MNTNKIFVVDIHSSESNYSLYKSDELKDKSEEIHQDVLNTLTIGEVIEIDFIKYKVINFELMLDERKNMIRIIVTKL